MSHPTHQQITDLATTWYHLLDIHAPAADLVALLNPERLEMVFPEATLTGIDAFVGWYEGVIRIFFDEAHRVTAVDPAPDGDRMFVKVAVEWKASRWRPPAPASERLEFDAYQTWEVTPTGVNGAPQIAMYRVDALRPRPHSAAL